jgi:hypothetical protein
MTTETLTAPLVPGIQAHRYERSPITGNRLRATRWHPRAPWQVYLRGEAGALHLIGQVTPLADGSAYAVPLPALRVPRHRCASLSEAVVALDALMSEAARAAREIPEAATWQP